MTPTDAPVPTGPPYTPAVRAGDWLVISGQVGVRDGALVDGGFGPELDQALANLVGHLEAHGATPEHVAKTTVFLVDMADFPELNARYSRVFAEPRPARSAFAVAALPFGAHVEIEAWAWLGD